MELKADMILMTTISSIMNHNQPIAIRLCRYVRIAVNSYLDYADCCTVFWIYSNAVWGKPNHGEARHAVDFYLLGNEEGA
jgi:hypothetical protein